MIKVWKSIYVRLNSARQEMLMTRVRRTHKAFIHVLSHRNLSFYTVQKKTRKLCVSSLKGPQIMV